MMPVKTKFRWELIKSLFLLCDTANQVICNYTYVRNSWPTGSVGTLKRKAWTKDLFQVLCNITNRFITVAFSFSLGFLLLKIFNDLSLHVCAGGENLDQKPGQGGGGTGILNQVWGVRPKAGKRKGECWSFFLVPPPPWGELIIFR